MQKKTIVHIIQNLGRGGAETMLVTVLKHLNNYNNIVITLDSNNQFKDELQCSHFYCLQTTSAWQMPKAALQLKKILQQHQVDMVHTHLFWPTIIARLAVPKKIPLLTTIHAFIATSLEYKHLHIKWLDKLTYRLRPTTIIAVAKGALHQYFDFLKLQPYKSYALYTFADLSIFNIEKFAIEKSSTPLKIISVGALRTQKNYQYLLQAMHLLRHENVTLDIYGTGPLEAALKSQLALQPAKVNFKGEVANMHTILPQYDVFTLASTFEGFSLAVLEAMAMKVPLLLSDIISFKEQGVNTAMYFSLQDANSFVEQVYELLEDKNKLTILSETAYKRVTRYFTLPIHLQGLNDIYTEALGNK